MVTLTPEARNRPPKRLLKIWLPSSVAVAWLVISIPGEEKEKFVISTKKRQKLRHYLYSYGVGFWKKQKKLTCSEAVKNAVLAEYRVAVCADQHTGLSVPEDVVLFQESYRGKDGHDSNCRYTGAGYSDHVCPGQIDHYNGMIIITTFLFIIVMGCNLSLVCLTK